MKILLSLVMLAFTSSAFAQAISAQTCLSADRNLTLSLPALSSAGLGGPLKIVRGTATWLEVTPTSVSNLVVHHDGLFSFDASNAAGQPLMSVKTAKDSVDRLIVVIAIKEEGMVGFACPKKH